MGKKRFALWQLLLTAVCCVGVTLLAVRVVLRDTLGTEGYALLEAWELVNSRFVGDYEAAEAADFALAGLVDGLGDRWSYYLDAESYEAQNERRGNSYVGIGVTVDYSDERGLFIKSTQKNSPAEQAGLRAGEVITAVDGVSLAGEGQSAGTELIRGEAGTAVTLTVLDEAGAEREVEVFRAAIQNASVTSYTLLENGVGYVALGNFYSGSAAQLNAAVDELVEQGATALLFDMRNNGGGYVNELTDMLDHLLPEGVIFRSETVSGQVSEVKSDASCVELPMATLVNADTYSAAEFFAAQLRESLGAPIVGEHTSGKGYSQQAIALANGGALNLSTGKYTTGGGVSLVGIGVTLDAEVSLSAEEALALASGTLEPTDDPQLQAALALLQK